MAKKTNGNPAFETKDTTQYSTEGLNMKDLLGDPEAFQRSLSSSGLSRRNQKRLTKAYNTMQDSGLNYILSEDGTGFNVFDPSSNDAALTRSSRITGNTKGVNLADLVGLGNNLSKLAGFAAQRMGKEKTPITDTEPRGLPAKKTSDVNTTGDAEVQLDDGFQSLASWDELSKTLPGNRPPSSTPSKRQPTTTPGKGESTSIVDNAYKRSQDLIMNQNAQADPLSLWGGLARNPSQVHQEQIDSTRLGGNVDEEKLSAHMKGIRGQFEKRLGTLAQYNTLSTNPMFGHPAQSTYNTRYYADLASEIYGDMIRSGLNPDIDEITAVIENQEIEKIDQKPSGAGVRWGLKTAATLIPIGRAGVWGLKGGAAGMKSLASKYPKFAKWLASKGVAKPLQFPKPQTLPSVSSGAKEFLKGRSITGEAAKRMAREGAGPVPKTSKYNWEWMNERIGSGFAKGGKIAIQNSVNAAAQKVEDFHGAPVRKLFSIKSLMGY